jgi:hypothetical protein
MRLVQDRVYAFGDPEWVESNVPAVPFVLAGFGNSPI